MTITLPFIKYYTIGDSTAMRRCVTYTPASDKTLRQFTFTAQRMPNLEAGATTEANTIQWYIYAADGSHHPTGTALKSGIIDFRYSSVWKVYRPIEYTVVLPSPLELTGSTEYAFVFMLSAGTTSAEYVLAMHETSSTDSSVYCSRLVTSTWLTASNSYNLSLSIEDEQAGADWHVVIDGNGYMTPDMLQGYRCDQVSSGLAQTRGGQSEYSQMRYPYSNLSQDDWTSGSGQLNMEDLNAFQHAKSVDTTVPDQAILGPLAHRTGVSTDYDSYEPTTLIGQKLPYGTVYKVAQLFTTAAGGYTATTVSLHVNKTGWCQGNAISMTICPDSGGSPDYANRLFTPVDFSANVKYLSGWVDVDVPGAGQALSGSTDYWLVIEVAQPSETTVDPEYNVFSDLTGSFADGTAKEFDGSWSDITLPNYSGWTYANNNVSLAFRMDGGQSGEMNDDIVKFAYGSVNSSDGFYCLAGQEVYKWNNSNEEWDALSASLSATGTDLICFNDTLFVAQGYSNNAKSYDGSSWSDAGDAYKYFGIGKGYMWASTSANTIQHSNDGSTWSSDITVGEDLWEITGFINYAGRFLVGKEDGIWAIDDQDLALEYLLFREHADADNCKGWSVWSGMLFIPVQGTIWRWQGSQYKESGPTDQRAGPTDEWPNEVTRMASTPSVLYATASPVVSTGRGGLMAYNGMGWHHLTTHTVDNATNNALYVTTEVNSEFRVWYAEGKRVVYITLPEHTHNRYDWASADFAGSGVLVTSWWDGGLKDAVKFWNRLTLLADIPADTEISVYFTTDGENWEDTSDFVFLGTLDEDTMTDNGELTLMFPDGLTAKSVQLIFMLKTNTGTSTPRIRAYNIESVVRQQPVYAHSFRVLLADNITKLNTETESTRDAQDMWEELTRASRKNYPITISFPFASIRAMITSLSKETYRYTSEDMDDMKWELVANISAVEAT